MNNKPLKLVTFLIILMIVSCDEPETVVTNIVHPDGSITRKIEMRKQDNKFIITDIQVPLDSTWIMSDSCEISNKGDTTWIMRAEKTFKNVEEINLSYRSDTGCNSNFPRYASFNKRFRWFNTIYRFSETIGNRMKYGYPMSGFINEEESRWFHSPDSEKETKMGGADSLRFKALNDSVDNKLEEWTIRCLISEWIGEFSEMLQHIPGNNLSQDTLKANEDYLIDIIMKSENDFDSLWQSGYILREFIGEHDALEFRKEADSALTIITDRFLEDFSNYTVRISLPGRLTETNGFTDNNQMMTIWPVISEYFLTENYEMWAESSVPNRWAWLVSGIFVLFVLTGALIRKNKRS
jgi:hypothetical protein